MGRLIDADALKRKVQRLATQAWKMQVKASVETILNQFIDDIDHAPTVDAAPVKHGRWKRHYCDDGLSDGWQCSVCGEWYYFGENKPNFCPNCGAKMDEKDGEEHD